jgi:hypothetical protein
MSSANSTEAGGPVDHAADSDSSELALDLYEAGEMFAQVGAHADRITTGPTELQTITRRRPTRRLRARSIALRFLGATSKRRWTSITHGCLLLNQLGIL